MKEYKCKFCNSDNLFIDERNNHKGLFCGECGKWQKWLGKDEYNLVKRFIESKNKIN